MNTDYVKHPALDYGSVVEISEPILIRNTTNYHLDAGGATIVWTGAANVWPIRIQSAIWCSISNLRVISTTKSNAVALITNEPGELGSTGCRLTNVVGADGSSEQEGFKYGFQIDSTAIGGADQNNDLHVLDACGVYKYSDAAYYLRGTQVHNITLKNCHSVDYVGGRWPKGVHLYNTGYVNVRDCNMGGHSYDIYSEGPDTRIVVDGLNSEHSRKLGRNSTNGAESFVSFKNVRWEGDPLPEDPVVFEGFGCGPFGFENGWVDGDVGSSPRMTFTNYSDGQRTIKGSLRMFGWCFGQQVTEYEPGAGPEVSVPRGWAFLQSGCVHITKKGFPWIRRAIRVERGI